MGKRKIEVKKIEDDRIRVATFQKRKMGLIKKAMELSVLCEAEVALVIFGAPTSHCKTGKLMQYSSKDIDLLLTRFIDLQPSEIYTNDDYDKFKSKTDKELEDIPASIHKSAQEGSGQSSDVKGPASAGELHQAINFLDKVVRKQGQEEAAHANTEQAQPKEEHRQVKAEGDNGEEQRRRKHARRSSLQEHCPPPIYIPNPSFLPSPATIPPAITQGKDTSWLDLSFMDKIAKRNSPPPPPWVATHANGEVVPISKTETSARGAGGQLGHQHGSSSSIGTNASAGRLGSSDLLCRSNSAASLFSFSGQQGDCHSARTPSTMSMLLSPGLGHSIPLIPSEAAQQGAAQQGAQQLQQDQLALLSAQGKLGVFLTPAGSPFNLPNLVGGGQQQLPQQLQQQIQQQMSQQPVQQQMSQQTLQQQQQQHSQQHQQITLIQQQLQMQQALLLQ